MASPLQPPSGNGSKSARAGFNEAKPWRPALRDVWASLRAEHHPNLPTPLRQTLLCHIVSGPTTDPISETNVLAEQSPRTAGAPHRRHIDDAPGPGKPRPPVSPGSERPPRTRKVPGPGKLRAPESLGPQ